jgi:hypothetical protein
MDIAEPGQSLDVAFPRLDLTSLDGGLSAMIQH